MLEDRHQYSTSRTSFVEKQGLAASLVLAGACRESSPVWQLAVGYVLQRDKRQPAERETWKSPSAHLRTTICGLQRASSHQINKY